MLIVLISNDLTDDHLADTTQEIVDASMLPLSIIVIGMPWDNLNALDHDLPQQQFDNFNFVSFEKIHHVATEEQKAFVHRNQDDDAKPVAGPCELDLFFTLQVLMDVRGQYECMCKLYLLWFKKAMAVNVWVKHKNATTCSLDLLQAIQEQFRVLLDAQHCVLSFELVTTSSVLNGFVSVLEFNGRDIRQVVEQISGSTRARQQARCEHHCLVFLSTAQACAEACIEPLDGCNDPVQSYLCMPLVDCSEQIQAVVEVFNSRHDAKDIMTWIGSLEMKSLLAYCSLSATSQLLRAFCGFVGALLRAASPITNLVNNVSHGDIVDPVASRYCRSGDQLNMSEEAPLQLLDSLQRALDVNGWIVYALDHEADILWACFASAKLGTKVATAQMGQGIIGRAALTAEALFDGSVLCIPVFDHSRNHQVISVVVFYGSRGVKCDNGGTFRQCDVELCNVVCGRLESFLQRLALEDAANKAQDKAEALLELSDLLFYELEQSPKPTAMILAAARAIVQKSWFHVTECNVYLRDPLTHELCSPGNATQGEFRVPLLQGSKCAMVAARTGNVVNVGDTKAGSLSHVKHPKAVLAVPVKDPVSGVVLAVLELRDKHMTNSQGDLQVADTACSLGKPYFDHHDEDFAKGIARQVASALRNIQRVDAARIAQRKSAALLSLRLPVATGTMPGEQAGAMFSFVEAAACKALKASHGALFLVDPPSRSLFARLGADWRGYALAIGQKLQGRVAATGAAVGLVREARIHPDFDSDYDRLMGMETSSLLCVPIEAQPSMSTSLSSNALCTSSGTSGRSGHRCSSFSTSSSTDDDSDDRRIIGVFYAVNKINISGDTEGFDAEDEQILRAICDELSALVERRAWEIVFESPSYEDSESSDSETEGHVTRTFLSQYTTASPVRRRRRPRSRLPSVVNDYDHAAAIVAATSYHEGCFLGSTSGSGMLSSLRGSIGLPTGHGIEGPVLQWDLDPWQYSPAQLIDLAVNMFELHGLMDGFALPEATLRRFLRSVQAQYLDVPYHNTYHAFATLHMTFLMLSAQSKKLAPSLVPASIALGVSPTTKAQAVVRSQQKRCGQLILAPRERLALFVAAFCHDMGHDARTNDFHVRCNSRLARRYNDHSVLENMHAAACFETMRRPGHDVLAGLEDGSSDTAGSRRIVRKRIIRSILATDMHRHASIVARLHEAQVRGSRNDDGALRELLVDAVIHSADVSGPTQSCEQHFRWTTRLLEEFNEQHAEEVELGISATTFMDGRPDSAEFARVNLAFVDSCAFPLWRALGGMLAGLEGCLANVERNRAMWATKLEEATRFEDNEHVDKIPANHFAFTKEVSPERLRITIKSASTTETAADPQCQKAVHPADIARQQTTSEAESSDKKMHAEVVTSPKVLLNKDNKPFLQKEDEPMDSPQENAKTKLELHQSKEA
ncbi:unnamed protein product [Peronospora belbahrii]|uniref:Phosphodiesterase n=1 Tax=Peronospora belbahrii TaxID=622444 RepID=A0ABN8CTG4_9STRA|nr:unnamed protein product [Peronospora belbahrii]